MDPAPTSHRVEVAITIDTEEDNWGVYATEGATVRNITHLIELQEHFTRFGARPTYLVNRPPLLDGDSVEVLGTLKALESVEIGAHCHPWNTPPFGPARRGQSMMCALSDAENRDKLVEIRRCLSHELGVQPRAFRAGRWGFGPTVARPLVEQGFEVDSSVTPLLDWSDEEGADYTDAPLQPYRFDPDEPLRPRSDGRLLQLPVTVGFLRGDHRRRQALRVRLERSAWSRLKVVGLLDRSGFLARRWLSPESSSGETLVRLAEALVASGHDFLHLTFHSCVLLPGATPFVRDWDDRTRFLRSMDRFLRFCESGGFVFRTLSEAGGSLRADRG